MCLFGCAGIVLFIQALGQPLSISAEPELGSQNLTRVVPDAAASGGRAIAFKTNPKRFGNVNIIKDVEAATTIPAVETALRNFLTPYNMSIQLTNVTPSSYAATYVTFDRVASADLPSLKLYAALFIDEWSKYPATWTQYTKVKGVALIKNHKVSGQARAASPDIGGDIMYYDIGYTGTYARGIVHHEFEHLKTYNNSGIYAPADPTWTSYNPSGFKYGPGGSSCYNPSTPCPGIHPLPGFVTGYATSALEEDKAELYSYLMTTTYYKSLNTWVATDTNLKNKVIHYKEHMLKHSPEITASYWDQINP